MGCRRWKGARVWGVRSGVAHLGKARSKQRGDETRHGRYADEQAGEVGGQAVVMVVHEGNV